MFCERIAGICRRPRAGAGPTFAAAIAGLGDLLREGTQQAVLGLMVAETGLEQIRLCRGVSMTVAIY